LSWCCVSSLLLFGQRILIAHGDWCGGYALYVKDGRLVHDYNYVGIHYVITSDRPVPSGGCTLGVSVAKTGDFRADATLLIDGQPCGEVEMPRTLRAMMGFPGLDVGRHPQPPLGDYEAPFTFTGTLDRIVVELADDQRIDVEARDAAAMKAQ
jgi:arylsulfatase